MIKMRKITVLVPERLVKEALRASGQGITPTVKLGLESVARRRAYEDLLKLEGKVHFKTDLKRLREDRG